MIAARHFYRRLVLLASILLLAEVAQEPPSFAAGWDGVTISPDISKNHGVYELYCPEELACMAQWINARKNAKATYRLMRDIDLGGAKWKPIGLWVENYEGWPFRGTFDGNGKTISGLRIDYRDEPVQGLFGYVAGGRISNIRLVDVDIDGGSCIGALVGWLAEGGRISGAFASGRVKGGERDIGGLVGRNDGRIANSGTALDVEGQQNVGGLIGLNTGHIDHAYARGTVKGEWNVGGLVGYFQAGSVTNTTRRRNGGEIPHFGAVDGGIVSHDVHVE